LSNLTDVNNRTKTANSHELIGFIRAHFLDPPSTLNYSLPKFIYESDGQYDLIDKMFHKKVSKTPSSSTVT